MARFVLWPWCDTDDRNPWAPHSETRGQHDEKAVLRPAFPCDLWFNMG